MSVLFLLGFVRDFQNNLAASVSGRDLLQSFACISERKSLGDDNFDLFGVDQFPKFGQLFRVWHYGNGLAPDAARVELTLDYIRNQRCDESAFLHNAVGTRQRVFSN